MEINIHFHKLVSTEDNYEKHLRIDNKTLISLIQKPSLLQFQSMTSDSH